MIILTDLSEVLIHGFPGTEKIVSERYGVSAGSKFWDRKCQLSDEFKELLRGQLSEDEFWKMIFQGDDWEFGPEDAKAMFGENLSCPRYDGVLEIYEKVKDLNHAKLWIVSDHLRERVPELLREHQDVFAIAEKVIWSCDVHKIKSDPGFFEELLHTNGLSPKDVIFIDDFCRNVSAAGECGIPWVHFRNAKQLESELEKLGLQVR